MELKINLSNSEHKDLISFCNLNDLLVSETIKKSYLTGFNIERFGLLSAGQNTIEVEVEKEVIKYIEVPIETIKEVIKIEYVDVPVEKIVEVIKEVVVEKIVEVIKEVPSPPMEIKVIEYVDREVVKEVIKEVFVSNIDNIYDKPEPIIVEKIVEVIREVEKIVEVEKIIEVIKEVEKDGDDKLKLKMDALQNTLQKIRTENIEKDKIINEYQKTIEDIQKFQENKQAIYLSGSNLNKKM